MLGDVGVEVRAHGSPDPIDLLGFGFWVLLPVRWSLGRVCTETHHGLP